MTTRVAVGAGAPRAGGSRRSAPPGGAPRAGDRPGSVADRRPERRCCHPVAGPPGGGRGCAPSDRPAGWPTGWPTCSAPCAVPGPSSWPGCRWANSTPRLLAARLPTSVLGNVRSTRLVDDFDAIVRPGTAPVVRSRDPRVLERWLPTLLAGADPRARSFLRASARLHAGIGEVELAVVADGERLCAGLLTLVDGADRWPWWGRDRGCARRWARR